MTARLPPPRPILPKIDSLPGKMTWRDEMMSGNVSSPLRVVRHVLKPGASGFNTHTHEFAEVFWCETGIGTHTVNGQLSPLEAGDVVFIRPDDVHSGRATTRAGLTFVNVSFMPEPMRALAARYPAEEWPWRAGPQPLQVKLSPRRMERLHTWAAELAAPNQRLLDLECFLLDIARLVTQA